MITLSTTIWRRKEEHFSFVQHQIIAALPKHCCRGQFFPFLNFLYDMIDSVWWFARREEFEYTLELHPRQNAKCTF